MRRRISNDSERVSDSVFDKDHVLHAKMFVFDRKEVFIGSINLDPRSRVENTEIGIVMAVPESGEGIGDWVDNQVASASYQLGLRVEEGGRSKVIWKLTDGSEFTPEAETSAWKRFKMNFFSILPIESLL